MRKEFIKYVSFNIVAMLGFSCYVLGDTFFVAQATGADGLAALNIAIPAYSLVAAVGYMLGVGGATRFSLLGGKKTKSTAKVFTNVSYLGAAASVIFVITGIFFIEPLSRLLGAEGEVLVYTIDYLQVILVASPFFVFNNMINAFVRNDKEPRLAMIAMFSGSIMNIILDYIFMFKFGMGIFGAALATGIAPALGLAILSTHFIRRKNNFTLAAVKPDLRIMVDSIKPGGSAFVTELSNGIVILVFNLLMLELIGNIGVTAYGVVANIAIVILAMLNGVAQGMQPLISSYYGKGDKNSAAAVYKMGIVSVLLIAAVIYAVSLAGAGEMASMFNSSGDETLQNLAQTGIRIYFAGFLMAGINITTAAYFGAIGNAGRSVLIGSLRAFAVIIPAAFIMSWLFGVTGLWLTFPVAETIVCIISIYLNVRGHKEA